MSTLPPRAVVVHRATDYETLLRHHGTREQARFFLESRGSRIDEVEARHAAVQRALGLVSAAIPAAWRRARVAREDLDRFLFEPEDVVVAVGQDGLVANLAKYVRGQSVIGVNPSRELFDGILVRHPPEAARDLLPASVTGRLRVEERSMALARTSDGLELRALNEIFVGHRTHQSARYTITATGKSERHSSSGLIVTTGTGATGWARSMTLSRRDPPPLPAPTARELTFLVREAWPSVRTGAALVGGVIAPGEVLAVRSEMNEGGVAFGDGIEDDRLELPYGQEIQVSRAPDGLRLAA